MSSSRHRLDARKPFGDRRPFRALRPAVRRGRARLLRSPQLYWTGVAVLAMCTVVAVREAVPPGGRDVLVVTRDVAAGEAIGDAVELRTVPAELVPADALTSIDGGARANTEIAAGEVVIQRRLTDASSELAARLGERRSAVAVADEAPVALQVGDRVDLYGLDDGGAVTLLVTGSEVVALDPAVTVAVPTESAGEVLAARLASTLSLAVTTNR